MGSSIKTRRKVAQGQTAAVLILASQIANESLQEVAPLLFYAFAGLACLSAWAVVVSQNIVRMCVYLMLTLASVAGLYFMLNAEFLAAVQLIVYAGGTLILIVFGVMLTNKNPYLQMKVQSWEMGVGALISAMIGGLLIFAFVRSPLGEVGAAAGTSSGITGVSAGGWPQNHGQVDLIGRALLSRFLVPFEVSAVLLLVVMIGAAFMARRRVGMDR